MDVPDVDESAKHDRAPSSVTYARSFNRPTGLEDNSRVHLRIESWTGSLQAVLFNVEPLEISDPPLEVDISERIQPHNQIRICLEDNAETARLSGAVDLLIE